MGGRIGNTVTAFNATLPDTLVCGMTGFVRNTSTIGTIVVTVPSGIPNAAYRGTGSRTNLISRSFQLGASGWTLEFGGVTSDPVITADQADSPDGAPSVADQVDYPVVDAAGEFSILIWTTTEPVADNFYTFSIWLRTVTGVGTTYINATTKNSTQRVSTRCDLSTTWRRFSVTTDDNTTAGDRQWSIGPDTRVASQPTTQPAISVFAYGAQLEVGTVATDYIQTVGAPVTIDAATQLVIPYGREGCFVNDGGTYIHSRIS